MISEELLEPTVQNFLKILEEHTEFFGVHEAAMIFPMPTQEEYNELCHGISDNGQMEPVKITPERLLIDGRTRLMACYQSRLDPRVMVTEVDPWAVSIASNQRRNLTTGQKAMSALKIEEHYAEEAKERQGERTDLKTEHCGNSATKLKSRDEAAKDVGIGQKAVSKAKFIAEYNPDAKESVASGSATLEDAYKEARIVKKAKDDADKSKPKQAKEERPVASQKMVDVVAYDGEAVQVHLPKRSVFNKTNENVDWAGYTWNPVTGCLHGCKFCYANEIANKECMKPFYPLGFKPILHEYRLEAPKNTRPDGRVFVCSMADLFGKWVPDEWITKVFDACMESPDWEYMFLTKWPKRYKMLKDLPKAWFGASVIQQADVERVEWDMQAFETSGLKWISLEPMLRPIIFNDLSWCDLVVIGSQTAANGEPEIAPEFDWVVDVVNQCRKFDVPYYLKPNLMELKPGMVMPRNLPYLGK